MHLDRFPGAWISPLIAWVILGVKAAETAELDLFLLHHGGRHTVEDRSNHGVRLGMCEGRPDCQTVEEIGFVHRASLFLGAEQWIEIACLVSIYPNAVDPDQSAALLEQHQTAASAGLPYALCSQ